MALDDRAELVVPRPESEHILDAVVLEAGDIGVGGRLLLHLRDGAGGLKQRGDDVVGRLTVADGDDQVMSSKGVGYGKIADGGRGDSGVGDDADVAGGADAGFPPVHVDHLGDQAVYFDPIPDGHRAAGIQ